MATCCFRIDKNVVLGTETKVSYDFRKFPYVSQEMESSKYVCTIFGKAIRLLDFNKQKSPNQFED